MIFGPSRERRASFGGDLHKFIISHRAKYFNTFIRICSKKKENADLPGEAEKGRNLFRKFVPFIDIPTVSWYD